MLRLFLILLAALVVEGDWVREQKKLESILGSFIPKKAQKNRSDRYLKRKMYHHRRMMRKHCGRRGSPRVCAHHRYQYSKHRKTYLRKKQRDFNHRRRRQDRRRRRRTTKKPKVTRRRRRRRSTSKKAPKAPGHVGEVLGAGHRQDVFRGRRSFARTEIRAPFRLRKFISTLFEKKLKNDLVMHFNGDDYTVPTTSVKKSSKSSTLFWRGHNRFGESFVSVTDSSISGVLKVAHDKILSLEGGIGDSLVVRLVDRKKLDQVPRKEAPYAPPPPPGREAEEGAEDEHNDPDEL